MSELLSFEEKKSSLIEKYEIRLEVAKLDSLPQRIYILDRTLKCIQSTKSSWEIDACLDEERKKVLSATTYEHHNDDSSFSNQKRILSINYQKRIKRTDISKKKYILKNTLNCVHRSNDFKELTECKEYEQNNLEEMILSYEDNPHIKNSLQKEELINRYQIRLELARMDRMYDRVELFNNTLICLKRSQTVNDIKRCKESEKNKVIQLIKS